MKQELQSRQLRDHQFPAEIEQTLPLIEGEKDAQMKKNASETTKGETNNSLQVKQLTVTLEKR